MFWPRLQLTEEEQKYCSKYADPATGKRGVLRRIYNGTLTLNAVTRQPVFSLGISRRTRVFGMTASGDLTQFRIQLSDTSGEQYLPDYSVASNVFGGFNLIPPSSNYPAGAFTYGMPLTLSPFIMEPNICLDPNQSLVLSGLGLQPYAGTAYFMEVCFHVWEFPQFYGTSGDQK